MRLPIGCFMFRNTLRNLKPLFAWPVYSDFVKKGKDAFLERINTHSKELVQEGHCTFKAAMFIQRLMKFPGQFGVGRESQYLPYIPAEQCFPRCHYQRLSKMVQMRQLHLGIQTPQVI